MMTTSLSARTIIILTSLSPPPIHPPPLPPLLQPHQHVHLFPFSVIKLKSEGNIFFWSKKEDYFTSSLSLFAYKAKQSNHRTRKR